MKKHYLSITYKQIAEDCTVTNKEGRLMWDGSEILEDYLKRMVAAVCSSWETDDGAWFADHDQEGRVEMTHFVITATASQVKLLKTMISDCEADLAELRQKNATKTTAPYYPDLHFDGSSTTKPGIDQPLEEYFGWNDAST